MTAALFIHGILGSPDYFDFLYPYVPDDRAKVSLLLEGHGGSAADFGRASMARWREQVREAVVRLKSSGHRVMIVAHSMGTLFAIENAVDGMADSLFLQNPPLSIHITRRLLTTPLKVVTGKIDDDLTRAAKAAHSIADDRNPLHYIGWLPRYLELFREIRRVNAIVSRLSVPTRVYLSARDEMVSLRSARAFDPVASASVTILTTSGHYYYSPADRATIIRDFRQCVADLS